MLVLLPSCHQLQSHFYLPMFCNVCNWAATTVSRLEKIGTDLQIAFSAPSQNTATSMADGVSVIIAKHVAKWPTSLLLPWCGLTAYLAGQPYQRWAPAMAYSSVSGYLVRATRCNCDKPLRSPGWPAVCWNSWQLLPSHFSLFHHFLLSLSSFLWHGHFLYNATTIISVKLQRQRQQQHIHNSCLPRIARLCLYHYYKYNWDITSWL